MTNPLEGNPLRSRADVARAALDCFEPLLPHFSAGGARVRLGSSAAHFSREAAELEGFARPLWGIAALVAGGGEFPHWDVYRRGLANGTDPDHPEYWGELPGADQRMVEMAAIGFALALVPEHLWEPLDEAVRHRLACWLDGINRHEPAANNHQLFRVIVDLGLRRVGVDFDVDALERSVDRVDGWYVGEGWYRDGWLDTFDHYGGFALHFYGLVYAALAGDVDPDRATRYRNRAREFAPRFRDWFDARGRVVPYGRSMTYRFATAGFWAGLALAGEEALPWPEVKGLYLRHLRSWSGRPVARADATLTIGYGYEQHLMSEEYNSPGSPYWAMKAFAALAAGDDHPFWQAEEEEEEEQEADALPPPVRHVEPPGYVVARDETQAVVLNAGQGNNLFRQSPAKYAKFAYSSAFGFSVEADVRHPHHLAPDSMLALRELHGPWRVREQVEEWWVAGEHSLGCRWRPWPDVEIDTYLWGGAPWHGRVHRVRAGRELLSVEGGFAVGFDGDDPPSGIDEAVARTVAGVSTIVDLSGGRRAQVMATAPNTNLIAPRALLPVVYAPLAPGEHVLACAVGASDDPGAFDPATPPLVPDGLWP